MTGVQTCALPICDAQPDVFRRVADFDFDGGPGRVVAGGEGRRRGIGLGGSRVCEQRKRAQHYRRDLQYSKKPVPHLVLAPRRNAGARLMIPGLTDNVSKVSAPQRRLFDKRGKLPMFRAIGEVEPPNSALAPNGDQATGIWLPSTARGLADACEASLARNRCLAASDVIEWSSKTWASARKC